jgi:predicted nucleotidyltransferase
MKAILPTHPTQAMLLDQIREKKPAIDHLVGQFGARRLRVFGSVARGDEGPDSDIDFVVEFSHGYDLLAQRLPLTRELSDLLGRPVDLIPEHELNRYLRDDILKEAIDL